VIVHLEDEPAQVYAQIAAEGLRPGTSVRMMEATPERIRFWADGDERILAPVAAANVSVVPVPSDGSDREESRETLASLRPGEAATVIRISKACRGLERRRLLDLGILPGTRIEAAMKSPSGDPTAYRVRGTLVALRDEQAGLIHVGRTGEAER
jgi:DtxR family Mn-dependent transcriptional regulator